MKIGHDVHINDKIMSILPFFIFFENIPIFPDFLFFPKNGNFGSTLNQNSRSGHLKLLLYIYHSVK